MRISRLLTYSVLSLVAIGGFFGNVHIETDHQDNRVVSISYEGNGTYTYANTNSIAGVEALSKGDPAAATKATSQTQLDKWNSWIEGINMIFLILSTIVSPVILFVGWLMSPDWTSGDIFGLRTPMYTLWVTVSNIVYFIYAIMLILIALGTMFGKESFSYKVMLPKLALGILMVPFTWWFVQWTISLSSVVTASVMSIPSESIKESKWFTETKSIPKEVRVGSNSDSSLMNAIKSCKKPGATNCTTPQAFLKSAGGMYGPLMVYAYSVFNAQELTTLPPGTDKVAAVANIVHQSFIGMLMFLVFGLLILALGAMLLVRAMKLWIYAIFSPLFTFQFVAGAGMMGGDKDTFTIKEFVGLCFVPAIVGMTLSFGLIMISAIQSTSGVASGGNTGTCDLSTEPGCRINIMGDTENYINRKWTKSGSSNDYKTETTFKWGEMSFIFDGKAINQSSTETKATGALDAVGGMFGTIIIDIIALVFIWMAFMAAKNVSKAVQVAVKPFEDIGNQVGALAKKIPQYTPIPGLGMSANSIAKIPTSIGDNMVSADAKRFEKSGIGQLLNADKNMPDDIGKGIVAKLKTGEVHLSTVDKQALSRDGAYHSSAVKEMAETLKGMSSDNERNARLKAIGITDSTAQQNINKFMRDTTKNDLHSDHEKKEFLALINTGLGTGGGTGTNGGTPGSSSSMVNRVGTGDTINVNVGGEKIQVEVPANDTKVKGTPNLSKLVGKKAGMKEEDFIKNLMDHMKEDAAKDLVAKIKSSEPKFFD